MSGQATDRDTWNPTQYEKFEREREQPYFDLLALVRAPAVPRDRMRVVDLGCGTGKLTRRLLALNWPLGAISLLEALIGAALGALFIYGVGEIYFRLFSYARYLNQLGVDPTYVDAFGNSHTVQRRQDIQLLKFFAPFSGWFLTPKFRYYLYVWSSNTSQGDPAQVVGAGNLSYTFNRFAPVGIGITSLPSVRST